MAPVSRYDRPARRATSRETLDLPEPGGPVDGDEDTAGEGGHERAPGAGGRGARRRWQRAPGGLNRACGVRATPQVTRCSRRDGPAAVAQLPDEAVSLGRGARPTSATPVSRPGLCSMRRSSMLTPTSPMVPIRAARAPGRSGTRTGTVARPSGRSVLSRDGGAPCVAVGHQPGQHADRRLGARPPVVHSPRPGGGLGHKAVQQLQRLEGAVEVLPQQAELAGERGGVAREDLRPQHRVAGRDAGSRRAAPGRRARPPGPGAPTSRAATRLAATCGRCETRATASSWLARVQLDHHGAEPRRRLAHERLGRGRGPRQRG